MAGGLAGFGAHLLSLFRHNARAMVLVWTTHRGLTIGLALLTLAAGALPAATAYVGALIVDAAVDAMRTHRTASGVLRLVLLEAVVVAALAGAQRGIALCQALLRTLLAHRVTTMILEKALTLDLEHFEDPELYDRLSRARHESTLRPLSLVMRTMAMAQNLIALVTFASLLARWSPWAVAILVLGGLPGFLAETKFSNDAFRLFQWRSREMRMQVYLETVLARDDFVKEVKLFGLGPRFLARHADIFQRVYPEEHALVMRRHGWGLALGLLATMAFYGAYAWIALSAVRGAITLGQMTMYLVLFRQGQTVVSSALSGIGGMYEDMLYLSVLYEFLETPVRQTSGGECAGPEPGDGLRFQDVSFTYPGGTTPALQEVTLHLPPGRSLALIGENGCGKTTLIKLVSRLHRPTRGRILLDGLDLNAWDEGALRRRMSVVFQDFTRYQMQLGENIGAGDDRYFDDEARWRQAALCGRADAFAAALPKGYHTQLGKWFQDGRELSGGEWQRVAVSRAFIRTDADIFMLDEPTATLDARGEAEVFETIRKRGRRCMAILISHRLAVARIADEILVLEHGRVLERGSHDGLLARGGRYAHLFELQSRGHGESVETAVHAGAAPASRRAGGGDDARGE